MRKFIVILAGLAVLFTGCKKDNPEVTGSISLSQDMVQVNGLSEDYFVFVDNAARTIEIEIAYADVNELAALEVEFVNLPQGVTAEGFTCDFTATPSRLVSFSDGSVEVQYTVTAEAADPDPHFTSLTVNGVAAANNEVKLSGTSDLANAVVEFTVSPEGTKVMVGDREIESGATVDFSDKVNGVTFTLVCGEITNTDKYVAVTTGINNVVRVWGHYASPVTVTDDWFGTEMPAASGDWMRNIAMDNQYVYIPHASGTGGVYAVNVSDGKLAKAMSTTGISGGVHLTSDAEVMDNGSSTILLVCNLANNAAGNLTVYAYDNVDADPRVVLNYSLATPSVTPRLGDKMTAEGTWEKGKLYFFSACYESGCKASKDIEEVTSSCFGCYDIDSSTFWNDFRTAERVVIIDKFFIQFELSWKVLKELLRYEGKSVANTGSPREILKAAYSVYDFIDEDIWLDMLKSRNDMTHIYDGEAAKRLVDMILGKYIPAFKLMEEKVLEKYKDIMDTI